MNSCTVWRHEGPAIKTGFHVNQYWVCQNCKEEINEQQAAVLNLRRELEKEFPTKDLREARQQFGLNLVEPRQLSLFEQDL
jgi:hypothetical protein